MVDSFKKNVMIAQTMQQQGCVVAEIQITNYIPLAGPCQKEIDAFEAQEAAMAAPQVPDGEIPFTENTDPLPGEVMSTPEPANDGETPLVDNRRLM
jgi:hypothetical protein